MRLHYLTTKADVFQLVYVHTAVLLPSVIRKFFLKSMRRFAQVMRLIDVRK